MRLVLIRLICFIIIFCALHSSHMLALISTGVFVFLVCSFLTNAVLLCPFLRNTDVYEVIYVYSTFAAVCLSPCLSPKCSSSLVGPVHLIQSH